MTDNTDNLAAALAAFQAELPKIETGRTAHVKSDKGSYSYRYAGLSEISPLVLPLLGKHGLAWTTRPTLTSEGRFVLQYALTHSSGEKEQGEYPLPDPSKSPQVLGSAITYARRYALCAVTGVAPGGDDDDAAEAQRRHPEPARSSPDDRSNWSPAELRAAIAQVGERLGRSVDWLSEDFAARTQGGHPSTATEDELRSYLEWLEKQPDAWDTGPATS